eukprot:scaffold66270_cov31-Tisochrysis_lutea.AAC.1
MSAHRLRLEQLEAVEVGDSLTTRARTQRCRERKRRARLGERRGEAGMECTQAPTVRRAHQLALNKPIRHALQLEVHRERGRHRPRAAGR